MPRTRPIPLRPVTAGAAPMLEVEFVDADGEAHRVGAEPASTVLFENTLPMRSFTYRAGQHHTPGAYWSASTGELVGYESHLERQWMTALDFDREVTAFSSQPMTFHGADTEGTWRSTPDIFARRADGTGLVTEVKNPDKLADEQVLRTARRTRQACAALGLDYQLVGALDAQRWANLQWLAGYRRPLHAGQELVERILALSTAPVSIDELLSFLSPAQLAKPVLFHLLWHGRVMCEMNAPLRGSTLVRRPARTRSRA